MLEGYGLTEAAPIVTVNRPGKSKRGTVGPPIPSVEIRIAQDGEILVRGPNVMKAYLGDSEATREALDKEGFLHTGDIGTMDPDGFLTITDRKKEIIITSGGKNIPPQSVEGQLQSFSLIEQACLIGDGRNFLTALLVPNFPLLSELTRRAAIPAQSREELLKLPTVIEWFQSIVNQVNQDLAKFETIKRFELLPEPFSIEKGELTLTLKLRRNAISDHYAILIDRMYA